MSEITITISCPVGFTPWTLMSVIAKALGMKMSDYKEKRRFRTLVELRCIAAYYLKKHFKKDATTTRLGEVFGMDHTSVLHLHNLVQNMIDTKDVFFMEKFKLAEVAIDTLIKTLESNNEEANY